MLSVAEIGPRAITPQTGVKRPILSKLARRVRCPSTFEATGAMKPAGGRNCLFVDAKARPRVKFESA
jgi:hypothetical protein